MDPQTTSFICKTHTAQYIGILIIGILLGTSVSFVYFKQAPSNGENAYQAGFDAAKKRIEESGLSGVFLAGNEIHTLSGTVTAVNGNLITLQAQPIDPFVDPALTDRTVIITSDTKITKISQDNMQAFQTAIEAFIKNTQTGDETGAVQPPAPSAPTRTAADVSNIAAGDTLTVTAAENIKEAKKISASEIEIQ